MPENVTLSGSRLGKLGITALLAGQLLPMIDTSIVNVALDVMAHALHASENQLTLLIGGYGISFAIFLALSARLGDRFGRVRIFRSGILLFAFASLLCGIAPSITALLLARGLQGIGAALIVPQVLASLHVSLKGRAHARAIGIYSAIGGLSFITGQILGGFLVSANIAGLGWRSIFLINLPVCLAVWFACPHLIPETRNERNSPIDLQGTVILACLLLCILLPVSLGPSHGWPWAAKLALLLSPLLLCILAYTQLRQEKNSLTPLLPPALLRLPSIRFGLLLAILFFSCWSGFMFILARTLQAGAHLDPQQSGNAFVSMGAIYFLVSLFSTKLVARFGKTPTLLLGYLIQLSGLLMMILSLNQVWPHPDAINLLPALLAIGAGQALIVSTFLRISLADVPAHSAGAASAMLSTIQQTAMGFGPALLGSLFVHKIQQSGNYRLAAQNSLMLECTLILLLAACSLAYHLQQGKIGSRTCQA